MKVFFKLNNSKGGRNQVAYYHHQSPHNHVNWSATASSGGIGNVLYLCSNNFGRNGNVGYTSHVNNHGHFGYPAKGDLVVIFQEVHKRKYVVTHVLEFTDNNVETFTKRFGANHKVTQALKKWPWIRETKIVCVLNPREFGGKSTHLPDLVSTKIPRRAVQIGTMTGGTGYVANGRIYFQYGTNSALSLAVLKQHLSSNNAYDSIFPL